ncbi:hypothetical protein KIK04_23830 [Paenibacillus sp. 481]|nr:hypothetical protein KIK04_23830 [Paenibacillus sp. 481]
MLTGCEDSEQPTRSPQETVLPQDKAPGKRFGADTQTQLQAKQLQQFIVTRLTGNYGIHTNYRDTDQAATVATGHEVLSESAGLLMRYYARTGQQQAFDAEWARAKRTFDNSSGFSYRYSPKLNKRYPLNAAVDDLRIIRALHEAGQAFQDNRYAVEAATYGERFYKHLVKDEYVFDFYDETYQITNDFITLCYIDFTSLQRLSISSEQQQQLFANMLQIVQKGYLSDDFPFYETRYQYKSQTYRSEHINTVESMLTILALSEVRQHNPASIRYIQEHVKAGTLYGQYTTSGTPTNDIQSTAIYAIAAMIGAEIGDKSLYENSIRRMNQFLVQDGASPLKNGFGDVASEQAYSFDNLMALLAYTY